MTLLKRLAAAFAVAMGMGLAYANEAGYPLERFPTEKLTDEAALQHGAKLFVNYCLNCHGASSMRYNRLRDIGLTDDQIRKNLLFTADKVGEPMRVAMAPADAKAWFGALPPDLSVIARARASETGSGSDWLYTYLRSYYRDASRPTGWNNALFPNVGMPHILWQLQGSRGAVIDEVRGGEHGATHTRITYDAQGVRSEHAEDVKGEHHAHEGRSITLDRAQGGALDAAGYDEAVADLVAYITFMSDPSAQSRTRMGVWVLIFLAFFTVFAWWLNREYWKDIH